MSCFAGFLSFSTSAFNDVGHPTDAAKGGARHTRNSVHKKIPGCAVELNTQNCAWFGSQVSLITAMSFQEAVPPRTTHQGLCPGTPLGDFCSPYPLCPPPPNPGYATAWVIRQPTFSKVSTLCFVLLSIDTTTTIACWPCSEIGLVWW